jgi:alkanesulfonate monooxygenase SsuD/methylene tetrahydromethanopterin reductase-like flavin-dependent oxidoreductase (luciferase family)
MTLSIGLGLFTGQVPPGSGRTQTQEYADTLALARQADRAGFDSVWVSEHHGAADGYMPSMTVSLAALAAVTQRVELGMGVALGPLQHPLRFAEDCAVVDQISNGRLIVGLGYGWRAEEFRSFGVPIRERVGRTVELIEVCRRAWAEERFSFAGRYVQCDRVALTPRPARATAASAVPPGTIGIGRAGRLGDGFISSQWAAPPDVFLQRVAIVDAAAREAGRDPDDLLLVALLNVFVDPRGRLPDEVAAAIWHQLGTYAAWRVPTDIPDVPFALPPLDRAAVEAGVISGTPEQVVLRLTPWVEVLRHRRFTLGVRLYYPGMRLESAVGALELFAQQVLPRLRAVADGG